MAGETTARVTPAETPAPVMMLSGGMQGGGLPPEVTNAPPTNVQPQASDTFTTQQGPSMQPPSDGQQQQPQQMLSGPATDHEMVAAAVHHGRIGRAIDAVTKALGGNQTMHVVEMPDGSYVAKPMDSTPGERWSRIAKAALTGAAAGFAHGQGPGGPERAFAAGAQQGLALPQAEQDQTMKKAEDLEGQREKQTLFKKNMAMMDIQQAVANLQLHQMPIQFSTEMQQRADTQRKDITTAHGKLLATYTTMKDLNDHIQANEELRQRMVGTGGVLRQVPIYTDGKQTGAEVYGIPEDHLNQYNDRQVKVPVDTPSPDGKSIVTTYRTYEPGDDLNSRIQADIKSQEIANAKAHVDVARLQNEGKTADAAALRAETDQKESASRIAHNYAMAANEKDNAKTPKLTGYVDFATGIPYVFGKGGVAEPMKLPAGMTAIKATDAETFKTKTQNPALKAEEAYNMVKGFDANMKAGVKNPIEQRIALQMALQTASGMSPTGTGGATGKSNAALTSAMKDRGLADDKINLINRLIDGQTITPTQMDNALRTLNAYRRGLWREAGVIGAASHIRPEDVIPATVLKRDELLNEIYGRPAQAAGTGDASQAAIQPGQVQPTQQQAVPAGKFAVRVNGQVVGYGDDAKGTNYHAF